MKTNRIKQGNNFKTRGKIKNNLLTFFYIEYLRHAKQSKKHFFTSKQRKIVA